eukprot:TRINITY_DN24284_c0_g1_i1.p1 TRINITY_DN24284_c0_g1~~TRINITY_DN24284_c0_g1_i1.p1  ORF type:complete len:267 (-),score=76.67 TRINITY_DN24284_c0_g1_i1:37-837(-)
MGGFITKSRHQPPTPNGGATAVSPSRGVSPEQQDPCFMYRIRDPEALFLNYRHVVADYDGDVKSSSLDGGENKKNLTQIVDQAYLAVGAQQQSLAAEEKELRDDNNNYDANELPVSKRPNVQMLEDFDEAVVELIRPQDRIPLFVLEGQDHKQWIKQARWESYTHKQELLSETKGEDVSSTNNRGKFAEFVHSFDEDEARRLDAQLTFESMEEALREVRGENRWKKLLSPKVVILAMIPVFAFGTVWYSTRRVRFKPTNDDSVTET